MGRLFYLQPLLSCARNVDDYVTRLSTSLNLDYVTRVYCTYVKRVHECRDIGGWEQPPRERYHAAIDGRAFTGHQAIRSGKHAYATLGVD